MRWALSLSGSPAWSPISPSGTPPAARGGHTAIYDPVRDRMVVFGGSYYDAHWRDLGDTWALGWAGTVDVGDPGAVTRRLALEPPRPNPFHGCVTIDFEVPRTARVLLEIYDLFGRRVNTVEDALLGPGR